MYLKIVNQGPIKIEDICEGEDIMEEKESERYLGEVISKDRRNIKNIQARVNKGTGIVRKIVTFLDCIPFGKYYFEAGVILRNSLLVSSMLFNSEVWYNVTDAEINLLETVDLMLLRGILNTPKINSKRDVVFGAWYCSLQRNYPEKEIRLPVLCSERR